MREKRKAKGRNMHLTLHTDYAVRLLIYLANTPKGERVTADKVAEVFDISIHHLQKIVLKLAGEEYIDTKRGPHGGMRLSMHPTHIYLDHIVRLMEPHFDMVPCTANKGDCTIAKACGFYIIVDDALVEFMTELGQYTLQDCLRPKAAKLMGIRKKPAKR